MVDINRKLSDIDSLIIHCSASDLPEHDDVVEIKKWHLGRGWKDIGYHYFIDKKGSTFDGRPLTKVGAHCAGHNMKSIGICVSGKYDFNERQFRAALFLISDLMRRFKIPRSRVYPHNHFDAGKTCPNFDMSKIWILDKA